MGIRLRFGRFTFVDLGEFIRRDSLLLACPTNRIGHAYVYLVPHHGNADTAIPAVIGAISPRVAILNNGVTKGGNAAGFDALRSAMSIEDVWQVHRSRNQGAVNFPDVFIANLDEGAKDDGAWLKLSAAEDGKAHRNERSDGTHEVLSVKPSFEPSNTALHPDAQRADKCRTLRALTAVVWCLGAGERLRLTAHKPIKMSDWFSTLASGSELPMDAASKLQKRGFVVLPGPVPSDRVERLANAYTAAVASATVDDVKIGSTSTRVSDFVNRGPEFDPLACFRRYSRRAASSSAAVQAEFVARADPAAVHARPGPAR